MTLTRSGLATFAALLAWLPAHADPGSPAARDAAAVPAAEAVPAVVAKKEAAPAQSANAQSAAASAAGPAATPAQSTEKADAKPASKPVTETASTSGDKERTVDKKVAPPPKPQPSLAIDVDLTRQKLTVSENGKVAGSWAISSGRSGYRTPTGTFRPQWMARTWYSRKYDNAPMPHSIFFTGGFALHATYATGMLGQPASHGCVRQSPANASRLFSMVKKHGMDRTKIVVHGSPRDRAPAVARHSRSNRYAEGGQGYGQPVVRLYRQQSGSYYAPMKKKSPLASLFGDDEPPRYYYVKPNRQPRGHKSYGRAVYGYDANGNLVRLR